VGLATQAGEQLDQSLRLPEPALRRCRLKGVIEDLSAALRRLPADEPARLLRARPCGQPVSSRPRSST